MNCPECGGDMWDNRKKKESGQFKSNAPNFSCKDKECGGRVWDDGVDEPVFEGTKKPKSKPKATNGDSQRMMAMSYAKDVVVAMIGIQDLDTMADPWKAIKKGMGQLLND